MKCIVVDDEPLARKGMEILIKEIPELELIGVFSSVIDAEYFLQENSVDLLFLDIQMPTITGIEFLKLKSNPPMVVITTAYPEYALDCFEFNVIDYLTKPIKFDRFYKAFSKCKNLYSLSKMNEHMESKSQDSDFIFIRSNRKYIKVFIDKISHIEALKDYVIFHYESERFTVSLNLKSIESKLPEKKFIRVNKSYIINIDFVKSIDSDIITLKNVEIFIGCNYKERLMKVIDEIGLIKRDY